MLSFFHSRILIASLAILAGCSGPSSRLGEGPSWRNGASEPLTRKVPASFAPEGPARSAYSQHIERTGTQSDLHRQIAESLAAFARENNLAAPTPDGRLYAVCQELARIAASGAPLQYHAIEFVLHHYGYVEPSPHLILVTGGIEDTDAVTAQVASKFASALDDPAPARLGIGSFGEGGNAAVVVAVLNSRIELQEVSKVAALRQTFALRGTLTSDVAKPSLFVTQPDGAVVQWKFSKAGDRGFSTEIPCRESGILRVEINGEDSTGPTVLANFPLYCATTPQHELALSSGAKSASPAEAEKRMLDLVNQDRKRYRLPPLELHEDASTIARAHSLDMQKTGIIGHVSPNTGNAADRVKRSGVVSGVILENVARAYSVEEAEQGLMNSPGHRANILSKEVTHVGIGIVSQLKDDLNEMLFTQLFIRVPRKQSGDALRKELMTLLARAGLRNEDLRLSKIAGMMAQKMVEGATPQAAADSLGDALFRATTGYRKMTTVASAVTDLADFSPGELASDSSIAGFGVGVVQADHPSLGPNSITIVLLCGHKQ